MLVHTLAARLSISSLLLQLRGADQDHVHRGGARAAGPRLVAPRHRRRGNAAQRHQVHAEEGLLLQVRLPQLTPTPLVYSQTGQFLIPDISGVPVVCDFPVSLRFFVLWSSESER